jgi:4-hydroxy-3-polyprenylbenzoate decarboxylase
MPVEGVAHNIVIVSIEKTYPGQGMKVLSALYGAGQMMFSKYIIVVSSTVPVCNYGKVAAAVSENVRFDTDFLFTHGPLDVLDHSSDRFSLGGKMGIDATVKIAEERYAEHNSVPLLLLTAAEIENDVITNIRIMSEWDLPLVVLTVKKPSQGLDMRHLAATLPAPLHTPGTVLVAIDSGADPEDASMIAWLVAGNSDPSRDIFRLDAGALFIDATSKPLSLPRFPRDWPNVVCSATETIELVDRRWQEYGTGKFLQSPSLRYLSLRQPGEASVLTGNNVAV